MKIFRIYIDTSIIGGCLDEKFAAASNALLEMARAGKSVLLISDLLATELQNAPEKVRGILAALPADRVEEVILTEEAEILRDEYLRANVVGAFCANDAFHVALATVSRTDIFVSWKYKQIVHFEKIRGFNAVNLREGYPQLEFYSPLAIVALKPKTNKTFDCVEMKNEIQARMSVKYAGMTDEERYKSIARELMTSNDTIARWWRDIRRLRSGEGIR